MSVEISVGEVNALLSYVEALPHADGCISQFAPSLCGCARGLALGGLINLEVKIEETETEK